MKPYIEVFENDPIIKIHYFNSNDLLKIRDYLVFINIFFASSFRGDPQDYEKNFLLRGYWCVDRELKPDIEEAIKILWGN